MCTKTYTKIIYACGDDEEQEATFTACGDLTAENHEVKKVPLGSSRVKGKCGKHSCRNP
jgi:hypothetical protein